MTKDTPIDQMIEAFWNLCDDGDGWHFKFAVDQWWAFGAHCDHHPYQGSFVDVPWATWTWNAHSRGATDLSTAIIKVYEQAQAAHAVVPE
jgi:hypothetical protein